MTIFHGNNQFPKTMWLRLIPRFPSEMAGLVGAAEHQGTRCNAGPSMSYSSTQVLAEKLLPTHPCAF